ncbi:hypothetical protein OUZ56_012378 [Daphnia magna]|uniref:Uncharacterized protein n=1 Tax=Daphnia magna TaxID=35525 RepID=A0ABQ9Z2Y7_9CRUS|nr:hypothetical protein OUZ56_012378 [Daphnia magna]
MSNSPIEKQVLSYFYFNLPSPTMKNKYSTTPVWLAVFVTDKKKGRVGLILTSDKRVQITNFLVLFFNWIYVKEFISKESFKKVTTMIHHLIWNRTPISSIRFSKATPTPLTTT